MDFDSLIVIYNWLGRLRLYQHQNKQLCVVKTVVVNTQLTHTSFSTRSVANRNAMCLTALASKKAHK